MSDINNIEDYDFFSALVRNPQKRFPGDPFVCGICKQDKVCGGNLGASVYGWVGDRHFDICAECCLDVAVTMLDQQPGNMLRYHKIGSLPKGNL